MISHRSLAQILGVETKPGAVYHAEIHKAFTCLVLLQIPTMQVKHKKTVPGLLNGKLPSHIGHEHAVF